MKITSIKPIIVGTGSGNWVFCKVETDEGLVGWGEGSVTSKEVTVATAIEEHNRMLVGLDPMDIEMLWQMMYRYPRWRGGPALMSAISAMELALWDIKGKALGAPVWQMLGGKARDKVWLYAHSGGQTPEVAAENAVKTVEAGYSAFKTMPFTPIDGIIREPECLRLAEARMKAMREAVGDDIEILVETHTIPRPPIVVELAKRIEKYRPFLIEEIAQPEKDDTLKWLSERINIPIATGERHFTRWEFTRMCQNHWVSYIQPDIVHAGGILEMKKIAALAEAYDIECLPHNPQSELSTMASVHLDLCTPNCRIQEHPRGGCPWRYDLWEGEVEIIDGYALPPTKPGWGLELNEKEAAKHPYEPVNRNQYRFPDGSVSDI